jgi:adenylate cyclase class 2
VSPPAPGGAREREEVEVKIPVGDLAVPRRRLADSGARLLHDRHFEANELFDDAAKTLSSSGRTVRLRTADGRAILTYKGAARFQDGIKTREERETDVSEPGEAEAILAGIGLVKTFRYEKWREEWSFEDCVVALDETPIGTFVEVEGPPTGIRRAVAALELDFTAALPYSYARLYLDRRRQDPSLPAHMVFGGNEERKEPEPPDR